MQDLASGNVPVKYETLPGGFRGTDATVLRMAKAAMGKYGARSPKIRAAAINIIRGAGIRQKDYHAEAMALANWVKAEQNIRYIKDVYGQETLSYPEETLFNTRAGDCDDQGALLAALLGSVGIPTRFKVIGVTPLQYSHVYLQAKPKDRWITMDPIMSDKPVGWEVPRSRRAIEKTYPTNGPGGFRGHAGVQGMNGLGYVGDPRVVSHLEEPILPYEAGTGRHPVRSPARPSHVQMPSGLDTDAPIDPLMAFPPNQNMPQRYPHAVAFPTAPWQRTLTHSGVEEAMHPAEAAALQGQFDVMGPEALAGVAGHIPPPNMSVPAYMQTKTVVQQPEGVDDQFARAAMVVDPHKGDKVEYYGDYDGQERPPIRPYRNLGGVFGASPRDMLPGMGYLDGDSLAGPGLGQDASGNTLPSEQMTQEAPAQGLSSVSKLLITAGVIGAGFLLMKRRKRRT